jgi:hypothetical protein
MMGPGAIMPMLEFTGESNRWMGQIKYWTGACLFAGHWYTGTPWRSNSSLCLFGLCVLRSTCSCPWRRRFAGRASHDQSTHITAHLRKCTFQSCLSASIKSAVRTPAAEEDRSGHTGAINRMLPLRARPITLNEILEATSHNNPHHDLKPALRVLLPACTLRCLQRSSSAAVEAGVGCG